MAGMLPGVECARRRRFHLSSDTSAAATAASGGGSTRRTSFCLYTSSHEISHSSLSSVVFLSLSLSPIISFFHHLESISKELNPTSTVDHQRDPWLGHRKYFVWITLELNLKMKSKEMPLPPKGKNKQTEL